MHMPYLQNRFEINVLFKKIQVKKKERQREAFFDLINATFDSLGKYVSFFP